MLVSAARDFGVIHRRLQFSSTGDRLMKGGLWAMGNHRGLRIINEAMFGKYSCVVELAI